MKLRDVFPFLREDDSSQRRGYGEDRPTIPPPAMPGQPNFYTLDSENRAKRDKNLEAGEQRRQTMDAYKPQQQALINQHIPAVEKTAEAVSRALSQFRTKEAGLQLQQLAQAVQAIQQLLAQLPVLEHAMLKEDHGNLFEKVAVANLSKANFFSERATLAIQSGQYNTAIEFVGKAQDRLIRSVRVLEKHISKINQ